MLKFLHFTGSRNNSEDFNNCYSVQLWSSTQSDASPSLCSCNKQRHPLEEWEGGKGSGGWGEIRADGKKAGK